MRKMAYLRDRHVLSQMPQKTHSFALNLKKSFGLVSFVTVTCLTMTSTAANSIMDVDQLPLNNDMPNDSLNTPIGV